MIRYTFIVPFIFFMIFGCADSSPLEQKPVSDFEIFIQGDCLSPSLKIIIENKTANADSYLWDFGDGTTSQEINPIKVYARAGIYQIKLTSFSKNGSDASEKEVIVYRNSDGKGPDVKLTYQKNSTTALAVSFTIESGGEPYLLFFGDGTYITSNESNITHTYIGPGVYGALLSAENSEGKNCFSLLIKIDP